MGLPTVISSISSTAATKRSTSKHRGTSVVERWIVRGCECTAPHQYAVTDCRIYHTEQFPLKLSTLNSMERTAYRIVMLTVTRYTLCIADINCRNARLHYKKISVHGYGHCHAYTTLNQRW